MKRISVCLLLMIVMAIAGGCGGGSQAVNNSTGSVSMSIDLATLQNPSGKTTQNVYQATALGTTTITAVTATLSRTGYANIVKDLSVVNNIASGTITGLDQGYWHIVVNVYENQSMIYTGSVDANVIAGAQVAAEILFDPVTLPPEPATTGSIDLTVGLNKYPGYAKIRQFASTILQDVVANKMYIFDSSANILAVYNADTMVREKDITLQAPPQALTVEPAGGSLLVGYSTGKIYRLKISDQSLTLVADSLISVTSLTPITSNIVLVGNGAAWGPSNTYMTINLATGQTISSKSYWYPLSNFCLNQANGMVYALDSGLSPADVHHLAINMATGIIDSIADSRYHGDYSFGAPIRIINGGSRIATASGNMFISSASATDDITYAGNLGHPFLDLVSDDALGNLYILNSDNVQKLIVIKQDSFFTSLTIDLISGPKRLFHTANSIIVFAKPDSNFYVKILSKQTIGLK